MNNAELIAELRGHIREVPLTLLRDAADALEADEKKIAELEAQLPKGGVWKKILQNGDGTSDYQCSACLGIIMDVPDDDEHPLCSFCPNCGARMRYENQTDNV